MKNIDTHLCESLVFLIQIWITSCLCRLRLRPRVLQGVSEVDMSLTVQGQEISMPICVAPTAMHCMAHPDGELATASGIYTYTAFLLPKQRLLKRIIQVKTLRWPKLFSLANQSNCRGINQIPSPAFPNYL